MSRLGRAMAAMAARAARVFQPGPEPAPPPPQLDLRLVESLAMTLKERLGAIEGFSELLTRAEGPQAASASRHILESSGELNRFLSNLQDFARHEQGRLGLVEDAADAAELIEAALGACRASAERADITILARLSEGVELLCDGPRLGSAISGIVLWLAEHAPRGSAILLRLLRTPQGGVSVAVTGLAHAPPTETLFEPRAAGQGLTGFTLPVARRVARLHGGDLTAEHGMGSVITLYLVLPRARVLPPRRTDACERCAA